MKPTSNLHEAELQLFRSKEATCASPVFALQAFVAPFVASPAVHTGPQVLNVAIMASVAIIATLGLREEERNEAPVFTFMLKSDSA